MTYLNAVAGNNQENNLIMMKSMSVSLLFIGLFAQCTYAQNASRDSAIIGVWKGTSLCQVKNSPCHDETVVYYITKSEGPDGFSIQANKIVNGEEQDMGTLHCKLDKANNTLTSTDYNSRWTFNFKNDKLDGTLFHDDVLYRIVALTRQQ